MSASTPSPSRKRAHPDAGPETTTIAVTNTAPPELAASSPLSSAHSPSTVAANNIADLETTEDTLLTPSKVDTTKPPQKRRKFTAEEKEQQRLEKEAKDKARQEQKEQREKEKQMKDEAARQRKEKQEEEKRLKDEAAKAKREQLEEKRRLKELEQAKKEEEKDKKERSQLRLKSFFGAPKPKESTTLSKAPSSLGIVPESNRSLSIEPTKSASGSVPPSPASKAPKTSLHKPSILPFELPSNAAMYLPRIARLSTEEKTTVQQRLENYVSPSAQASNLHDLISDLKAGTASAGVQYSEPYSVKTLMEVISGTSSQPIDLTLSGDPMAPDGRDALRRLQRVAVKYLDFGEDVRPPYCGTYTKYMLSRDAKRLARKSREPQLPEMNYEYDSEAEWEEPEEGEDLLSDGEEDLESNDDEEDMDGFLDDEEAIENKRRMVTGDLNPISSGLVWEQHEPPTQEGEDSNAPFDFSEFKMCFLLEPSPRSIDPFSTAYWATPATTTAASGTLGAGAMYPPRLPLSNPKVAAVAGIIPQPPGKTKRMVTPDQLGPVKAEIQGKDLTKIALVEHLKKKFPHIQKDILANTVAAVAERRGQKNSDKIWVLL